MENYCYPHQIQKVSKLEVGGLKRAGRSGRCRALCRRIGGGRCALPGFCARRMRCARPLQRRGACGRLRALLSQVPAADCQLLWGLTMLLSGVLMIWACASLLLSNSHVYLGGAQSIRLSRPQAPNRPQFEAQIVTCSSSSHGK